MSEVTGFIILVSFGTLILLGGIGGWMYTYPKYHVYAQEMRGKAELARAEGNRQILISQARAEKEAAQMQADAIKIMGEAAQKYPEYRQQEFISAFGQALRDGTISQIIYVPTEANLPILEAGKR